MLKFLKKNKVALTLVASLTLNVLGGAGVIPPVLAKTLSSLLGAAQ